MLDFSSEENGGAESWKIPWLDVVDMISDGIWVIEDENAEKYTLLIEYKNIYYTASL